MFRDIMYSDRLVIEWFETLGFDKEGRGLESAFSQAAIGQFSSTWAAKREGLAPTSILCGKETKDL